ncbi:hypothetical protein CUN61_13645 [Pseudomonas arsenicoxydans]|uniref:Uncharacterized protein n=1 Tax=Pseudomonas arsenicoxydans TaxID=702115 RepID=A0A4P6G465_9PSED|nr:hypothetical protein CUN61_13645 [Pseudomonas arsenicoxydans]
MCAVRRLQSSRAGSLPQGIYVRHRSNVGASLLAMRHSNSPQIPQSWRSSRVSRCFSTRSANRSISRSRKPW